MNGVDRKHYKCMLWKGLWLLAAVSFILAFVLAKDGGWIMRMGAEAWYWNALILGILAIPIKLDCHDCGVCGR